MIAYTFIDGCVGLFVARHLQEIILQVWATGSDGLGFASYGVGAIELAPSNCPPDSCIQMGSDPLFGPKTKGRLCLPFVFVFGRSQ